MFFKKENSEEIKKDYARAAGLIKRFDINTNQYYYCILNKGEFVAIPKEKLNWKIKRQLNFENEELKFNANLLKQEQIKALTEQRKKFFEQVGYVCSPVDEYLGISKGEISQPTEMAIDNLIFNEKSRCMVGIHRVGDATPEMIDDIKNNGLIITGHMNYGVNVKPELNNNVNLYADTEIAEVKKQLTHANLYKNSSGSILIKIPDEALIRNNDILISLTDGTVRLNPKYIVGYVPVLPGYKVDNIEYNSQYYEYKSYELEQNGRIY